MKKSLATLALIKANWDYLGKDYIENFVPFILALINKKKYTLIEVAELCTDFRLEYGLSIPYYPMISIIQRVSKRGYIERRRSDRKYHPVLSKIDEVDFTERANEQETKCLRILDDFSSFCKLEYKETIGKEDAENILISFLKDHDLDILFLSTKKDNLLPDIEEVSHKERYLFNSYVKKLNESGSDNLAFLVDMSIGHIISNTILCENYENYQESLKNCRLYLDIGFLFNLFGINGPERKEVHREGLKLMLLNKAKVLVFKHTYSEYKTILEGCLTWVSAHSYDIAKANRTLLYFIENGYSASDIEEFILNIEKELSLLGIEIAEAPNPKDNVYYQIDEEALQRVIEGIYKDREAQEHTILLDIKSIASIYKLRKGAEPKTLRDASHVLVSTNNSLAYASLLFEKGLRSQDYDFSIPAILTDVFVGTLMWINKPKASAVNRKRLIANCYASLLPSRALIKKMLDAVDRLRERGEISDEQVILLKESRVARSLLSKETLGDPERFTDKTPIEILEELKDEIRREEKERYDREKHVFEGELEKERAKGSVAKKEIESLKAHVRQLDAIKERLDRKALRSVHRRIWAFVISYLLLWSVYGISRVFTDLTKLDKFIYFLGAWPLVQYVYFAWTKKEIDPREIYEKLIENKKRKNYKAAGFDLDKYLSLKDMRENMPD